MECSPLDLLAFFLHHIVDKLLVNHSYGLRKFPFLVRIFAEIKNSLAYSFEDLTFSIVLRIALIDSLYGVVIIIHLPFWSQRRDLNSQQNHYERFALPLELRWQNNFGTPGRIRTYIKQLRRLLP